MIFVQHLSAAHDPNGNPQRLWAVYDEKGAMHHVVDEGYDGRRCLLRVLTEDEYRSAVELPSWEIPRVEYHRALRVWKAQ